MTPMFASKAALASQCALNSDINCTNDAAIIQGMPLDLFPPPTSPHLEPVLFILRQPADAVRTCTIGAATAHSTDMSHSLQACHLALMSQRCMHSAVNSQGAPSDLDTDCVFNRYTAPRVTVAPASSRGVSTSPSTK